MHLSVQFNHFNCAHWVAVRCEASGASEATPAVAEASGSYLYIGYATTMKRFSGYTLQGRSLSIIPHMQCMS